MDSEHGKVELKCRTVDLDEQAYEDALEREDRWYEARNLKAEQEEARAARKKVDKKVSTWSFNFLLDSTSRPYAAPSVG